MSADMGGHGETEALSASHASTPSNVVTIARRFRGPPDSANGGYACGMVAQRLTDGARVRLKSPPPLDEPLALRQTAGGVLELFRGEEVIAEGLAAEPHGSVPAPVSFDAAVAASTKYRWFTGHPLPGCFVCGPEREHGDGLCIFPGRVADRSIVAAPWTPGPGVCDRTGHVHAEVLWAALDCPSWFGALEFEPGVTVALLGQLTARILRRPAADERCIAIGWSRGQDGRKLYAGAALYTDGGELIGNSEAIWIAPRA